MEQLMTVVSRGCHVVCDLPADPVGLTQQAYSFPFVFLIWLADRSLIDAAHL